MALINRAFNAHAQPKYFGPVGGSGYAGSSGGYTGICFVFRSPDEMMIAWLAVYASAGSSIDWMNILYYDLGSTCYTTYIGLFNESASDCPDFPVSGHALRSG